MKFAQSVFKRGSTTYYYSSLLFPPAARRDVSVLYAFVRTADDFVDTIPQQTEEFRAFRRKAEKSLRGTLSGIPVIDEFCDLVRRYKIPFQWVVSFLDAMERDLSHSIYQTYGELENYMYGSAEVVGLMMCRILSIPQKAYEAARLQGRAMQFINFIRDVKEDIGLNRQYIPSEDLAAFGVPDMNEPQNPDCDRFKALIRSLIDRYRALQKSAESGYRFIPKRMLVPIKTAADMYAWTADVIYRDPMIIYRKKVKPGKWRILSRLVYNYCTL